MRILVLGTAFGQIYESVILNEISEHAEGDYFLEEGSRRHIPTLGEMALAANSRKSQIPTIRPPEFEGGQSLQQVPESAFAENYVSASGALTSGTVAPVISAEEGLQFLHKVITTGVQHIDRLGKVLMDEFEAATSRKDPFLPKLALATVSEQHLAPPGQFSLQHSGHGATGPLDSGGGAMLASASSEQSPLWPWWRSSSMFNEAMTRSGLELMSTLGYSRQAAIDGWYGVMDQWAKVWSSATDFQQRMSAALWKVQEWTVGMLIPQGGRAAEQTSSLVSAGSQLMSSAELSASSARNAGEEESEAIEGMLYPSIEFLPLELSVYSRN